MSFVRGKMLDFTAVQRYNEPMKQLEMREDPEAFRNKEEEK